MCHIFLQWFNTLLGDRKGIRPVKKRVSVCWWSHFDCNFARLIAAVVPTTSVALSFSKTDWHRFTWKNGRQHGESWMCQIVNMFLHIYICPLAVQQWSCFFLYTVPQAIASFPPRTTPPFRSTLPRSVASVSLLCHGVVPVLRGVVGCVLLLMRPCAQWVRK